MLSWLAQLALAASDSAITVLATAPGKFQSYRVAFKRLSYQNDYLDWEINNNIR